MLERLVEEGLEKGLTQKQAEDYANRIFFSED
jgi:pyrroline-5-carboxylate reductase